MVVIIACPSCWCIISWVPAHWQPPSFLPTTSSSSSSRPTAWHTWAGLPSYESQWLYSSYCCIKRTGWTNMRIHQHSWIISISSLCLDGFTGAFLDRSPCCLRLSYFWVCSRMSIILISCCHRVVLWSLSVNRPRDMHSWAYDRRPRIRANLGDGYLDTHTNGTGTRTRSRISYHRGWRSRSLILLLAHRQVNHIL